MYTTLPSATRLTQSVVMSGSAITEGGVYACAGRPLPADIEEAAQWLLNDPLDVVTSSALAGF